MYTNSSKQVHLNNCSPDLQESTKTLSDNRRFKGFGYPLSKGKSRTTKKAFQTLLPEDRKELRKQCSEILETHEVSLAAIAWQGYQEKGKGVLRVSLEPGANSPKNAEFEANWVPKAAFRLLGSLTMRRFMQERIEQCDHHKSFLIIFGKRGWNDGIEFTPSRSPQECFEVVRNREIEFGLEYRGGSN